MNSVKVSKLKRKVVGSLTLVKVQDLLGKTSKILIGAIENTEPGGETKIEKNGFRILVKKSSVPIRTNIEVNPKLEETKLLSLINKFFTHKTNSLISKKEVDIELNKTEGNIEAISKEVDSRAPNEEKLRSQIDALKKEVEDSHRRLGKSKNPMEVFKNPSNNGKILLKNKNNQPFIYSGKKVKKGETLYLIKEITDSYPDRVRHTEEVKAQENITIVKIKVRNGDVIDYEKEIFSYILG